MMKSYLNENNYPRVSSITRSILFWIIFLGLLVGSSYLFVNLFPPVWSRFAYGIFGTLSAIFTTWMFIKIEKKSFKDIGLVWERGTIFRFFKGILIGTIIFILILFILLNFTELQLQKNTKTVSPWNFLGYLVFVPLALMEEVAFRSYPFLKLNKAWGLRITQIFVAIAFALYHILNGWSAYSSFAGPFVWAFVFGLAAIWSGGIAMPTGIHIALNVIQPLIGIKGSLPAIWTLDYKEGTTADQIAKAENFQIGTQLVVLIGAVALTELFIRKKRNKGKSPQ